MILKKLGKTTRRIKIEHTTLVPVEKKEKINMINTINSK